MSSIRRQSIISAVVVYFGFALGLLNTYLFTRQGEGGFTTEQYGLTGIFIAFASIMFSVAGLGMPAYVTKFFPYYQSHADERRNDQLAWALLLPCLGFLVVFVLGIALKDVVVDRIFNNSPELLQYYYWTFPFGLGYTLFMVMEAYAWQRGKAVFSNTLKEVVFRFFVTILIVLIAFGVLRSFDSFIRLYAFAYLVVVGIMVLYLRRIGKFNLSFSVSNVTRKFYRKVLVLVSFVWSGGLIFNFASVFDTIIIAAVLPNGMAAVAPFLLAQNISSLIQAPQRAVISASVGPLSHAWKEKDYQKINTIYKRSSINQLIFSSAMFSLIWLNFEDGIYTFNLQRDYLVAKWAFFFLGLTKVVDMGTGVNSQIIGTSTFWRFEFISGLILFAILLPLNWQLTRYLGIMGPAISNLAAFTVYNLVRYLFLYRKFRMQPFTLKTLYTLLLTASVFLVAYILFNDRQGLQWIIMRSTLFAALFVTGALLMNLTPDLKPVLVTLRERLKF